MTWRERIAAAKKRGNWTQADITAFRNRATCLAAETALNLGVEGIGARKVEWETWGRGHGLYDPLWPWSTLWEIGDDAAVVRHEPWRIPEVERTLDQIEDEALRIKRGLAS